MQRMDELESKRKYVINSLCANLATPIVNICRGPHNTNERSLTFNKHFRFTFEAHSLQYRSSPATPERKYGTTNVKTFVHSLPWNKLYFYLTESEYDNIVKSFQSARVESVTVKIFNMGVRTTGTTHNAIGIWKDFEKFAPVTFGSAITPALLYGTPLNDLPVTEGFIPVANPGAMSQNRFVDNRFSYNYVTTRYDDARGEIVALNKEGQPFPPLHDLATLVVIAENFVGLLYEQTYKPKGGLFHDKSFGLENKVVFQHEMNNQITNVFVKEEICPDFPEEDEICPDFPGPSVCPSIKRSRAHPSNDDRNGFQYGNVTIAGVSMCEPGSNSIGGLGIGLFPEHSKVGKKVETCLNVGIQTEIQIMVETQM